MPWILIADSSTLDWDTIALEADINGSETVTVEIWGIPLAAGTGMDQVLGSLDQSNAVTTGFVNNFRNTFLDMQVVQEAGGRLPMIIEYTDQEGNEVREFIFGHITEGDRCAYVHLIRIDGLEFLPEEYLEIEQNLEVSFGEAESSGCAVGLADCGGGQCVDLKNDVYNCGNCGGFCGGVPGPGESSVGKCVDGKCQAVCLEDADYCGELCTDLSYDYLNCGTCGFACSGNQICCDGRCIDANDAERFCNFCGYQAGWPQGCVDNEDCDGAICFTPRTACSAGETDCNNKFSVENSFNIALSERIYGQSLDS